MWRAFFMAIGVFACFLGAECLVVDRFVLAGEVKPSPTQTMFMTPPKKRELVPPEAAPWTLLSLGSISILYSLTLPKLGGGGGGDPGGGH
jgi:hypothetical protein